jgi:hypothetical protein
MVWQKKPAKGYMAAFDQLHGDPMGKSGFNRTKYSVGRDANHDEIVKVYESAYIQVIDYTRVGSGHPDIGIVNKLFGQRLREIKMPGEDLESNQKTWWANWRGPPLKIIHSRDEALADLAELVRS